MVRSCLNNVACTQKEKEILFLNLLHLSVKQPTQAWDQPQRMYLTQNPSPCIKDYIKQLTFTNSGIKKS